VATCFKPRADGSNAAVHHVRRSDDIAACFDLNKRLPNQHIEGFIVGDIVVDQKPVMTVVGIGVQCNVAKHANFRNCVLYGADRAANQIASVCRFTPIFCAQRCLGVGEKCDNRYTQSSGLFGCANCEID